MPKVNKFDGLTDEERLQLEEESRQRPGEKHSRWQRRAAAQAEKWAALAKERRGGVPADPEHLVTEDGDDEDDDE